MFLMDKSKQEAGAWDVFPKVPCVAKGQVLVLKVNITQELPRGIKVQLSREESFR